jgi:lysophospholipase II
MHQLSIFRYRPSIVTTFASTAFITAATIFQQPQVYPSVFITTAMMMSSSSSTTTKSTKSFGKKGAIIFLHGLGDGSPNGWEMSLEQQLTRFNSKLSSSNVVYIFPNAPTLPISINGGTPMPGWFDLYDWPVDLEVQDDEINIVKSISSTNDIITQCMKDYNLNSQQIIIAGFSQGGAIALLTAYHPKYRLPQSLGGCINLSGWLPFRQKVNDWSILESDMSTSLPHVPLFWGHGQYDEIVLIEHQKVGVEFLLERGLVTTEQGNNDHQQPKGVQSLQYPVGHSSDPNEMKAMADFVDQILLNECDAAATSSDTS